MSENRNTIERERRAGAAAHVAGRAKSSNPNDRRTLEHVAWECGFDGAALADLKRELVERARDNGSVPVHFDRGLWRRGAGPAGALRAVVAFDPLDLPDPRGQHELDAGVLLRHTHGRGSHA